MNDVVPKALVESVTLMVTEYEPAVVGVPLIDPVEALIDSPAGRPVAAYVKVEATESDAWICTLATVLAVVDWLPGLVTVTTWAGGGGCALALSRAQADQALPLLGLPLAAVAGIWDGRALTLLAAATPLGSWFARA